MKTEAQIREWLEDLGKEIPVSHAQQIAVLAATNTLQWVLGEDTR